MLHLEILDLGALRKQTEYVNFQAFKRIRPDLCQERFNSNIQQAIHLVFRDDTDLVLKHMQTFINKQNNLDALNECYNKASYFLNLSFSLLWDKSKWTDWFGYSSDMDASQKTGLEKKLFSLIFFVC